MSVAAEAGRGSPDREGEQQRRRHRTNDRVMGVSVFPDWVSCERTTADAARDDFGIDAANEWAQERAIPSSLWDS